MSFRSSSLPHLIAALLLATACSSSADETKDAPAQAPAPAPAQPAHGAPVAFETTKLTVGAEFDGKLEVKAYNFSDKKVAGYTIAARYTDDAGKVLKVKVGSPFEADFAWTSLSGRKFACEPKSWCSFTVEAIEVPAGATKAEVVATSVRALAADGINFEDGDLWSSGAGPGQWPAAEAK